jgi:hypothetical protein
LLSSDRDDIVAVVDVVESFILWLCVCVWLYLFITLFSFLFKYFDFNL